MSAAPDGGAKLPTTTAAKMLAETEHQVSTGKAPLAYLGNQRMFRDKLFAALPDLADRILYFLNASVTSVPMANGTLVQRVADEFALTDAQVSLIKLILNKALPSFAPVSAADGETPLSARDIHISILQLGESVDTNELPGQVVGLSRAAAQKVSKISVHRPENAQSDHESEPEIIDVEAVPVDENSEVTNDGG